MSFDYKPVSLEEYDQALRDAVNTYYTHAMNDPNMSQEEALNSTNERAEHYFEAVEEFQENQEAQEVQEGQNEDVAINNDLDNGMDI